MNRQLGIFLLALGFLAASGSNESIAKQKKSSAQVVSFNGTLQDENLNVISGVFPMTFSSTRPKGAAERLVRAGMGCCRLGTRFSGRSSRFRRLNLEKCMWAFHWRALVSCSENPDGPEENPVVAVPTEGRAPLRLLRRRHHDPAGRPTGYCGKSHACV